MPRLLVLNLKSKEEQVFDLHQDSILIGRVNTCDIELPIPSISRRHAEINQENQDFFLADLGSGNGTFLNNKKLKAQEKNLLKNGDVIRIEDFEIQFLLTEEFELPASFEENADTDMIELKLIKKMMKALESENIPSLEVLNGSMAGKRIYLKDDKKDFFIGRGEDCDLPIPDNVLSRHHAKLEQKWGGIVVSDLGSKNRTFVNNEAVQEKLLRDGDRIMLGTIKVLYRNPKEVNVELAHQELSRKKKEAALQQAELLAKRQKEETEDLQKKQEAEKAERETQAQEVQRALEKKAETPAGAPTAAEAPIPPAAAPEKPKFSLLEKIFIGLGILVGIGAIGALITLLL
jgi:pSer/pThr/pTyr-binding forkhead associated (FHA) protein